MKDGLLGHLFIPGRLPGMNDLIDARIRRGARYERGKTWNAYSAMKVNWQGDIAKLVLVQGFPRLPEAYYTYVFDEMNRKRDPSNVIAGGVKFIEDALKKAGRVQNDGWRYVLGIRCFWRVNIARPGVHVLVTSDDTMTFEEAVYEADTPVEIKRTIAKEYSA